MCTFSVQRTTLIIEKLNRHLRQFAAPNDKKNIGKTFVAVEKSNTDKAIDYYTVSMAQILFNELPETIKKGLPKYPIPAMRIGKLAIDLEAQGNKIGALLLKDALLRAVNVSSQVALHFVVVDALNEKAKSFYSAGLHPSRLAATFPNTNTSVFRLLSEVEVCSGDFYLKYGFTAFGETPLTLVISLETIKAAIF